MSVENLTVEQATHVRRLEMALDDMCTWLDSLDPETDAVLFSIVRSKIAALMRRIFRASGQQYEFDQAFSKLISKQ